MQLEQDQAKLFKQKIIQSKRSIKSKYDLYDIILSHLLDEGYAETPEAAEAIMVNMSEDWRQSICEVKHMLLFERGRESISTHENLQWQNNLN
jgi:hypothetical protein